MGVTSYRIKPDWWQVPDKQKLPVDDSERGRRLDSIRHYHECLETLATGYGWLRWMAEEENATDLFLELAEGAGKLSVDRLQEIETVLDILRRGAEKQKDKGE